MDYQLIADSYEQLAVVVSIDFREGADYGKLRLVAANEPYRSAVRSNGAEFVPGMLYTETMERNPSFENLCLQCIVEKRPIHSYVNAPAFNAWLSLFMLPLRSDEEGLSYCLFSYDLDETVDPEKLADTHADTPEQVLKTCIRLWGSDDFDSAMESIIDDIRGLCDADYCCMLLVDHDRRECSVMCESIRGGSGMLPMETYLDDDFFDIIDTWKATISESGSIVICDEMSRDYLKEKNPLWASSLEMAGVKTVALYPMMSHGDIIGYIWAINFNTERTNEIKEILEETTFILSAEVANHQMFEELEKLSRTDLLTGVYNRNAMNNRIDSLAYDDPDHEAFGVVFADLNGLKHTNDTQGHASGDELLKSAAEALRKHFDGYEVYRAGGDEFMIYAPGISEVDFISRINALKLLSEENEGETPLSFAIGSCYGEKGTDVRKALHEADQMMYKEKDDYYNENPDITRRV